MKMNVLKKFLFLLIFTNVFQSILPDSDLPEDPDYWYKIWNVTNMTDKIFYGRFFYLVGGNEWLTSSFKSKLPIDILIKVKTGPALPAEYFIISTDPNASILNERYPWTESLSKYSISVRDVKPNLIITYDASGDMIAKPIMDTFDYKLNSFIFNNFTALHLAVVRGNIDTLKALIGSLNQNDLKKLLSQETSSTFGTSGALKFTPEKLAQYFSDLMKEPIPKFELASLKQLRENFKKQGLTKEKFDEMVKALKAK